jgi:hypothetical protein
MEEDDDDDEIDREDVASCWSYFRDVYQYFSSSSGPGT